MLLLLSGCFGSLRAQREGGETPVKMLVYRHLKNDSVLHVFGERFRQLDSLMNDTRPVACPLPLSGGIDRLSLDSLYEAKGVNELKAFRRRTGLELTGQVYQRVDDALGFDEDEKYSEYSTKFQGELGWNFFNSSFLQRRSETRRIRLSNELERVAQEKRLAVDAWTRLEDEAARQYADLMAAVLYQRLLNADVLNMAYQYTLERDRAGNEKLLRALDERMDLEYALLQVCSLDSAARRPFRLPEVTTVSVDSMRLFAEMEANHPAVEAGILKESLLDVCRKLTNYAQEMRLTPFVRASHYLRDAPLSSSTNIDVGVRFTFPLYDDTSAKRRALRTERVLATVERETALDAARLRCRTLLERLFRINETLVTEAAHLGQVERFIDMRRRAYLSASGSYDHVTRLEEYDDYLRSVERLCKLTYARDLCLIDLQRQTGLQGIRQLVLEKKQTEK